MADRRADQADARADGRESTSAAARAAEIRAAAAAKTSGLRAKSEGLRETAAAKGEELRETAAAKSGELRDTAAAKSGELRATAAAKSGELRSSAVNRSSEARRTVRQLDVPWARCGVARMLRETILQFGLAPLMGLYTRARVNGREQFEELPPPVIFVANHSSHLDTPTILRALPRRWRQRTAVGAAADYFYKKRAVANAVALIFNTVPILRRGGGIGNGSFDHVDRLIDQRWNLLIFPEGTRSRHGDLGKLHSGAAVIAQQHGIPIVPIHVQGTHDAMPPGRNWPKRINGFLSRRHKLEVSFGPAIWPGQDEARADVMGRVRTYLETPSGTVPQPAPAGGRESSSPAPAVPPVPAAVTRPVADPVASPVADPSAPRPRITPQVRAAEGEQRARQDSVTPAV